VIDDFPSIQIINGNSKVENKSALKNPKSNRIFYKENFTTFKENQNSLKKSKKLNKEFLTSTKGK
jgi:hypothetical protein